MIYFSVADIEFDPDDAPKLKKWISEVINVYGKTTGRISYLFCSDQMIHEWNLRYLNHDTYTDIITFDNVNGGLISGDIIISIDRVGENAKKFGVDFEQEFHRVLIHGVLHLLGFKDKSDEESAIMRQKENEALQILTTMR